MYGVDDSSAQITPAFSRSYLPFIPLLDHVPCHSNKGDEDRLHNMCDVNQTSSLNNNKTSDYNTYSSNMTNLDINRKLMSKVTDISN